MTPDELKASRPRHQELLRKKFRGIKLTEWEEQDLKRITNAIRCAILTEIPPLEKVVTDEDEKWANQSFETLKEATG